MSQGQVNCECARIKFSHSDSRICLLSFPHSNIAIERMRERICFTEMSIKVNPVRNTQFVVLNILFLEKVYVLEEVLFDATKESLKRIW